ncbi:hypothetical protein WAF17_06545 [Bernardetia sp. ABR2-2B]|uniref:hypothetical protein n=1 Tax=Bernardetia sp. ABR2-2B TaxID=3127472 RepID=UPI0030D1EE96
MNIPNAIHKIEQIVSDFIYLRKINVVVKITEIENWYSNSEDLSPLYVMLIGERINYETNRKKKENLYKNNSFFKYDEDDVFDFHNPNEETYIINSFFEKIEDKNLCVYIECISKTEMGVVVEKVANGFPLQGVLKNDILTLLYKKIAETNMAETLIQKKEEIEELLNNKIDKKKYAFEIDSISVKIENTNKIITFLNDFEKSLKGDFIYNFSHISPPYISMYLSIKNRQRLGSR